MNIVPRGRWMLDEADRLEHEIDRAVNDVNQPVTLDLDSIEQVDTSGAWLITRLERDLDTRGIGVELV
ncbi:MAG: STAS domain-containing protein, partial [Rhizobiales bacterium]|nr:STAS domain-containing protein [Hyphomicrobiales bacterium]